MTLRIQLWKLAFAVAGLYVFGALNLKGADQAGWQSLFNGIDLEGWAIDTAIPAAQTGPGEKQIPADLFSVVQTEGNPAIRVSGQIYGAITSRQAFTNFHARVVFKWGEKRWPPREKVARDSGLLYCAVGKPNPGTGWLTSVECNIMEQGIGQWWSVNGAVIDVEGEMVTRQLEAIVPYKKESPGESIIAYKQGAALIAAKASDGITPLVDDEKPRGQWNVVEVIFWSGRCLHLLNGRLNMVLTFPRFSEAGRIVPLLSGKLQLQSEGAECFYRSVEVRGIDQIPSEYLDLLPRFQADEGGFKPLLTKETREGWVQCGPGEFKVEDGVATGTGGMGLWWYGHQAFTNFVLRGEFLQEDPLADSGVFVRFPNPGQDPWKAVHQGHEMEIGDPNPEKPTWRTGSIYPFEAASKANTKPPGNWNEYEIVCIDHDYSVRINDRCVVTWTDPTRRSAAGHVGLQNYNDGKKVRHRNIRIKELAW